MKTTRTLILGAVIAVATGPAALAAHNNPWATEDDVVLAKKHDANQLRSIGTPGEDEMRGNMKQTGASTTGGGNRGGGGSGGGAKSSGGSKGGGDGKGGGKGGGRKN
jgi:hypothetical protein